MLIDLAYGKTHQLMTPTETYMSFRDGAPFMGMYGTINTDIDTEGQYNNEFIPWFVELAEIIRSQGVGFPSKIYFRYTYSRIGSRAVTWVPGSIDDYIVYADAGDIATAEAAIDAVSPGNTFIEDGPDYTALVAGLDTATVLPWCYGNYIRSSRRDLLMDMSHDYTQAAADHCLALMAKAESAAGYKFAGVVMNSKAEWMSSHGGAPYQDLAWEYTGVFGSGGTFPTNATLVPHTIDGVQFDHSLFDFSLRMREAGYHVLADKQAQKAGPDWYDEGQPYNQVPADGFNDVDMPTAITDPLPAVSTAFDGHDPLTYDRIAGAARSQFVDRWEALDLGVPAYLKDTDAKDRPVEYLVVSVTFPRARVQSVLGHPPEWRTFGILEAQVKTRRGSGPGRSLELLSSAERLLQGQTIDGLVYGAASTFEAAVDSLPGAYSRRDLIQPFYVDGH